MGGTGVIDRFLETFTRYIDSGFGLLRGDVAWLSSTLIAIDITLAGLFWALAAEEDVVARLVRKTLYVGFFAFLIGNWNTLAKGLFESFSGLGLKAAGSGVSPSQLLQPGRLAQIGVDAGKPILEAVGQLLGFTSFFENFVQIAVLMLAWLVVLVSFFVLAIQLFITLIEFKLTTLAGFVLVPFGLFNKTAFLAERVLGNVLASGVKVLVLAVIVGIGTTLFADFTKGFAGGQPSIEDALALVLAALSLLGLSIFGTGIATGLSAGAPQLGAGAAVGTAVAAGGLSMAGAMGARAGAGAVAAATRGGASAVGGAATAYRLGAATSGESGLQAAAAGTAGVARAGLGAAGQPIRQAAVRAAGSLGNRVTAGGQTAFEATGGVRPSTDQVVAGPAAANPPSPDGAPDWARRMKRSQSVSHGVSAAAHAVRSGDHGGGSTSVSLSTDERR